uniref:DNA2/NAM7 helicase-like C-terminal domain-containing protein n=1 Tax=Plectus sambesii TaxID=2011161 RepID=A0A914W2V6_9BILA
MVDMYTQLTYREDGIELIPGASAGQRSTVLNRMPMAKRGKPICAINIAGQTVASGGRSLSNLAEALATATLTKVVLKVGMTKKDIVVITMYQAQRRLIIHAIEQEGVGEITFLTLIRLREVKPN